MLFNYLKIAFRSILKNRLFSFINVFGLSFSIATGVIIIMLLADQYSFDAFNSDADRIYRVNYTRSDQDSFVAGVATTPMPLGEELSSKYPGIEDYTRLYRGFGNDWIKIMQDVNIPISGFFADPNVLSLFHYKLEYGDPNTALVEPYSVILTRETANKMFRQENPLGEFIEVGDLGNYKVTGILADLEGKSHIKFDALASMSTTESLFKQEVLQYPMNNWRNRSRGWTYLKLEPGVEPATIEEYLDAISHEQYDPIDNMDADFFLQNLRAINPGPLMGNQIGPGMPLIMVWFLAGLALVVIISSAFNYTNLSIARSLSRAREVGVRKVFGAVRAQIFIQFLMESVLIASLAYVFSVVIVYFLRPIFLELNFSQLLEFDLRQSFDVYFISLGFALLVGVLAGVLPAWFHSSVKALQALKDLTGVKVFSRLGFRRFLIVAQFSLSLFLVITVWLIYNQMNFMVTKEYGFNADNNVVIQLYKTPRERLVTELEQYSNLMNVSAAGFTPASGTSSDQIIKKGEEELSFNVHYVDENYLDNMNLNLIAGRNFERSGFERKVILNQKAVDIMGFGSSVDAVGKSLDLRSDSLDVQVIGVVEDYHHETLLSEIKPMMMIYDPSEFNILQVKINSGSYEEAIRNIEEAWAAVNPGLQIEYKLLSDEIAFFADLLFGDMTKIIAFISFLAILISCLGLLGMVIFSMQSRIKEVSIRKVLGATNQVLVYLLSKGFLVLMGISILITVPLAWIVNDAWLSSIAYRVSISWEVMFFSILLVSAMGVVVIGSQTWRTANTNPARVLRDE